MAKYTRTGRFKKLQQHKRDDGAKNKKKKGPKDEIPKKVAMISKPMKSMKHKKIKQYDPDNTGGCQQPNDKTSSKANRAPTGEDEEEGMSFSVREIMKLKESAKVNKKKIRRKQRLKELGPGAEYVDYAMTREVKGMSKPLVPVPKFARGNGETDHSFFTRVENAAKQAITKAKFEDKYNVQVDDNDKQNIKVKKKSKKHEKEMQRLKDKKLKKKAKAQEKKINLDFSNTKGTDEVSFGEVALAPPTLTAKPRKSEVRAANKPNTGSLLLSEIMRENKNSSGGSSSYVHSRKIGETVKRKNMSLAQQKVMDVERQRAIDMYRKMKMAKLNQLQT